jgi:hypothetical protein
MKKVSNTDSARSIMGALLVIAGVFACCLLPLMLLGGGLLVLSLLIQKEIWFALITVFLLALSVYAVYLRRKRN